MRAEPGALTAALNWYRAVPYGRGRPSGRSRPDPVVWGDRDRPGPAPQRGHRPVVRRAVHVRAAAGRRALDPGGGAGRGCWARRSVTCADTPAGPGPTARRPARAPGRRRRRRPLTTSSAGGLRPSGRARPGPAPAAARRWAGTSAATAARSGSSGPCPGSTVAACPRLAQPPQRVEVVGQPAVRVGDHRRAAAEDGVAGQHRRGRRGTQEAQRVGGVPGRGQHAHLHAGRGDHVALAQPLAAEPLGRVERAHRRAGQLGAARARPRCGPGGRGSAGSRRPSPAAAATAAQVLGVVAGPGRPRPRRRTPARAAARCWCRPASSATGWGPAAPTRARSPAAAVRTADGSRLGQLSAPGRSAGSTAGRPSTVGRARGLDPARRPARGQHGGDRVVVGELLQRRRCVGGIIGRSPRRAGPARPPGRTHRPRSASAVTSRVAWPCRQRGDEEAGVVPAASSPRRRDPVRPGPEQVGAQHQAAPGQQLGQREVAPLQRRPGRPPSPCRRSATTVVRGRAGQQHAGLLERLPHGGAHQRPGQRLVGAERRRPTRAAAARPSRPRRRRRAGRPRRPGRRSSRRRTPSPRTRRSRYDLRAGGRSRSSTTVAASRGTGAARPAVAAASARAALARARQPREPGEPSARLAQRTSTISSTSTGASERQHGHADRDCGRARPASPNTSPSSSLAPLTTPGWPVKSGRAGDEADDLDHPDDRVEVADQRFDRGQRVERAAARRAPWPARRVTSRADLAGRGSSPSTIGSWPEV